MTAKSLRAALGEVALTTLKQLRNRRLDAESFDRMLVDDLPRNVLRWLGDGIGARGRLGDRWSAFRSRCRKELEFDPESVSDVVAGQRLAAGGGKWASVWTRYADAPDSFPGVESVLRRCQPQGQLLATAPERWPNENDRLESALREALQDLTNEPHPKACDAVERLEAQHGKRRTWVWSRLGHTPLRERA